MHPQELKTYLEKTDRIVGKDWLGAATSQAGEISSYYRKLRFFYRRMHSPEGAMHFPIKMHKTDSHKQGLLFHVNRLDGDIKELAAKRVLELGCGVGFNLIQLAERNPDTEFLGVDLTEKNVRIAKETAAAKGLGNLRFLIGNFDELEGLETGWDLMFSIEALCHSADLAGVFRQGRRLLRAGGRFVIFDGYGTEKVRHADADTVRAADYFAKGFFLPQPQYLKDSLIAAGEAGFQVSHTDYTPNILSNFDRFEQGVRIMFKYPALTRALMRIGVFPTELFRHGLAGLYGPYLLQQGYAGYFQMVLE